MRHRLYGSRQVAMYTASECSSVERNLGLVSLYRGHIVTCNNLQHFRFHVLKRNPSSRSTRWPRSALSSENFRGIHNRKVHTELEQFVPHRHTKGLERTLG